MPRPTKSIDLQKRILVQFRVRNEEKTKLDANAKLAGLTVTDFIKQKTIDIEPKRKKANPEREILIKGLADLGRIGGNINQIAKVLNTNSGQNITVMHVSEALLEIKKLSNLIIEQLSHGD